MMDEIDQFIKKWTNTGIDTDGFYGYQCMDLMHKYCQEVLGLSDLRILAASDAKSVYLNFNNVFGHELFDIIPNTPTGVPLKGDIVFYGNAPSGHVDIFIQGDVDSYRSFSQNLPTGSKPAVVNHPSYANVLGWLRLKEKPSGVLPPNYADIIRKSSLWDEVEKLGFFTIAALQQALKKDDVLQLQEKLKKIHDLSS